jgi:peptide/nickel transport system substrate-binding protein
MAAMMAAAGAVQAQEGSDTLNIALNGPPLSFDPARADNGNGVIYTQLVYEPLIRAASDGTLQPGLATEWGYVGEGNKQFEVKIREGAKFSDRTPVTTEAVAASLNYFVKNATGPTAAAFAGITATAVDASTVSIATAQDNPSLPELMNQIYLAGDIIAPAGLANPEALASAPIGAGPYVLDASATVSGDHYTYTANPEYWDKSAQHFKTIVVKVIPSTTSALQALRTGQVDFMTGDAQTVEAAKGANLQVFNGPQAWEGFFLIDRAGQVVPAMGDVRVRQALNYAIDREAIATALYGEYGSANVQPNTTGWDGYDPALEGAYTYDPERAKALLAEAGYADGFVLPVHYFAVGQTETMVQAVASQLEEIGVTMELKPNPDITAYVTDLLSKQFPVTSLTFGGQPQFVNIAQNWAATGVLNPFGVTDPAFVELYEQAASASADEIDAKMKATMKKVVEDAYTLPVAQIDAIYFAREGLDGIKLNPRGSRVNPLDWTP